MNKSDTITKIASALTKAQLNIGAAAKGADNPFFKSRYADLGSVMAACKEPLLGQGIAVLQLVNYDEHGENLETILLHESGEFIASQTRIVVSKANDPQAMGSAITYARRYALQAMVFMPSVDDDAEWAERALRHRPEESIDERREREAREVAARGGTITEILPEVTTSKLMDWRDVVCHVGKAGGLMLGKKLGDMHAKQITWLEEKWMPKIPETCSQLEHALKVAVEMAIKEGAGIPKEATAKPATPEKVAEPTPEPKKPATRHPEPAVADWRSVTVDMKCTIQGETLGELDSQHLRSARNQLLPRLAPGESQAFADAVRHGCDELLVDADESELRTALIARFEALGLNPEQASQLLAESGVFDKETLADASEEQLRFIVETWPKVSGEIKGMIAPQPPTKDAK